MDNSAWNESIEWSNTSRRVQAQYQKGRNAALVLACVGAAFAAMSQSIGSDTGMPLHRIFAFASALAVAGAGFVGRHFISGDQERNWIMARAAAEALKSHAFRYACAVAPYQNDDTADRELAHTILNIQERSKTISRVPATTEDLQKKPGPQRHLPIEIYMTTRVTDQIDWYRKRAQGHALEQQKFQMLTWILGGMAIALGLLGSFDWSGATIWVAAVTTISGAILSHVATSRYEFLIQTYYSTADRLRHAQRLFYARALGNDEFVLKAEEIMTSENAAWVAEYRSDDVSPQSPPPTPTPQGTAEIPPNQSS